MLIGICMILEGMNTQSDLLSLLFNVGFFTVKIHFKDAQGHVLLFFEHQTAMYLTMFLQDLSVSTAGSKQPCYVTQAQRL